MPEEMPVLNLSLYGKKTREEASQEMLLETLNRRTGVYDYAKEMDRLIRDQMVKVQKLKSDMKPRKEVDGAVHLLNQSKNTFKTVTGVDWTPDFTLPPQLVQDVTISSSTN